MGVSYESIPRIVRVAIVTCDRCEAELYSENNLTPDDLIEEYGWTDLDNEVLCEDCADAVVAEDLRAAYPDIFADEDLVVYTKGGI